MPKPVKFSVPKPDKPRSPRSVRFDTSFDFGRNAPKAPRRKKPAGGAAGGT